MARTVVAGIAARAARSAVLPQRAVAATSWESEPSSASTTAAADTCQMKGIDTSQASTILIVAALTDAATFSRQPPIHATNGTAARGSANVEPRTCQRLTT